MNKEIPKTKEECFAQLDAMLSEEDKKALMEGDIFNFHFSLGLWIRNNWIYPLTTEEEQSFFKMFADDNDSPSAYMIYHPDMKSTAIIEKYVEYLKAKELKK